MAANECGLIIVGAGGHAKVIIATAQALGIAIRGLYDDDPTVHGQRVLGIPVSGACRDIDAPEGSTAILAIGSNIVRRRLACQLDGLVWATLVHPAATVHESVRLGPGCVVFAGAVVQPDAVLGAHVIVNTGASVDHDCRIGDFVHIAPGARLAGNVRVGEGSLMGIGSCAAPNTLIGASSIVGAGGAVTDNIPDAVVAAGVPARIIRRLEDA